MLLLEFVPNVAVTQGHRQIEQLLEHDHPPQGLCPGGIVCAKKGVPEVLWRGGWLWSLFLSRPSKLQERLQLCAAHRQRWCSRSGHRRLGSLRPLGGWMTRDGCDADRPTSRAGQHGGSGSGLELLGGRPLAGPWYGWA